MNKLSKLIAVLLVLTMFLATVPAAYAAGQEVMPGESTVVSFKVTNILGIDGTITVDDPNGIVSSSSISSVNTTLAGTFSGEKFIYATTDMSAADFTINYKVTLNSSAAAGKECVVTFKYEVTDTNLALSEWKTVTQTVVVGKKAADTTIYIPGGERPPYETLAPVETTKPAETTKPIDTTVDTTKPAETTKAPVTVKPSEPDTPVVVTVDYTELKKQIEIAEGLNQFKYTADSWEKVVAALTDAKAALSSKSQKVVDDAAAALAKAISDLVELDFTALLAAIEKVEAFLNSNEIAKKAQELLNALANAQALLNSATDQATIDAAAAELASLMEQLEQLLASLFTEKEIIKEVEKIVEVYPEGDYCNISIHHVWPILFFVSLAVNVGLIVLVVVFVARKKKTQVDDTPVVDYDIGDDA